MDWRTNRDLENSVCATAANELWQWLALPGIVGSSLHAEGLIRPLACRRGGGGGSGGRGVRKKVVVGRVIVGVLVEL